MYPRRCARPATWPTPPHGASQGWATRSSASSPTSRVPHREPGLRRAAAHRPPQAAEELGGRRPAALRRARPVARNGPRRLFHEHNRLRLAEPACLLLGVEMDHTELESLVDDGFPFVASFSRRRRRSLRRHRLHERHGGPGRPRVGAGAPSLRVSPRRQPRRVGARPPRRRRRRARAPRRGIRSAAPARHPVARRRPRARLDLDPRLGRDGRRRRAVGVGGAPARARRARGRRCPAGSA